MRVAVIGGAGGMGRVTVTDLARSQGVEEARVVDLDLERARELADALGDPVTVAVADDLRAAIEGVDAVVNAASHRLNVSVMEACLEAGAHYTDLGGLFHFALAQYELDEAFGERGLAAAISMGSAPGLTNMLAAACCERLDTVDSIEIADAFIPGREPSPTDPYVPPYAAGTLIDEFTEPAAVFLDGELRMVPADSGARVYEFPEGSVECVYTIHSEPATLPRSYAAKGIRNVEWRLGLPALDVQRFRSFIAAGLTSREPIDVAGDRGRPARRPHVGADAAGANGRPAGRPGGCRVVPGHRYGRSWRPAGEPRRRDEGRRARGVGGGRRGNGDGHAALGGGAAALPGRAPARRRRRPRGDAAGQAVLRRARPPWPHRRPARWRLGDRSP